ncbi:MAG: hypothetical protein CMI18_08670 [Opitutaceae bacterium]|nr:hypothetical protein [Opitutaceae bacterium]
MMAGSCQPAPKAISLSTPLFRLRRAHAPLGQFLVVFEIFFGISDPVEGTQSFMGSDFSLPNIVSS